MRMLRTWLASVLMPLACGALLCACGGGGNNPRDAATPADAGTDGGGRDGDQDGAAPPVDADEDGISQALDCDDGDPAVGSTAETDCTNACGSGTSTCTDGDWSECTAPTDCLCTTAGETRTAPCGNCGEKAQQCGDSGTWEDTSVCLGEGECTPATVDTEENDFCEVRQRLCGSSCTWGAWTVTRPAGECRRNTSACPDLGCFGFLGFSCDEMCVQGPPPDSCDIHCADAGVR